MLAVNTLKGLIFAGIKFHGDFILRQNRPRIPRNFIPAKILSTDFREIKSPRNLLKLTFREIKSQRNLLNFQRLTRKENDYDFSHIVKDQTNPFCV